MSKVKRYQFWIEEDDYSKGHFFVKHSDYATLEAQVAALEAERDWLRVDQRWISVGDRLPDYGVPVQTLYHDEIAGEEKPMLAFAMRDNKGWLCFVSDNDAWDVNCYTERWYVNHPTHWQPLPKAPL